MIIYLYNILYFEVYRRAAALAVANITKGEKSMKGMLLAFTTKLVAKVATISAGTLCLFIFHQPKVPQSLINK